MKQSYRKGEDGVHSGKAAQNEVVTQVFRNEQATQSSAGHVSITASLVTMGSTGGRLKCLWTFEDATKSQHRIFWE